MHRVLDILTSGVHDAKNQLFNAESLIVKAEAEHCIELTEARFAIEQAASRLNRVLAAYKLQRHLGKLSIEMAHVDDLLNEALLINRAHCRHAGLALDTECAADCLWPLDRELVLDMISNAIQNASRFAKRRILVSTTIDAQGLLLRVEDDGDGFADPDIDHMAERGIGLFVARELTRLHTRGDQQGFLVIYNGGRFGGGVFEARLP